MGQFQMSPRFGCATGSDKSPWPGHEGIGRREAGGGGGVEARPEHYRVDDPVGDGPPEARGVEAFLGERASIPA